MAAGESASTGLLVLGSMVLPLYVLSMGMIYGRRRLFPFAYTNCGLLLVLVLILCVDTVNWMLRHVVAGYPPSAFFVTTLLLSNGLALAWEVGSIWLIFRFRITANILAMHELRKTGRLPANSRLYTNWHMRHRAIGTFAALSKLAMALWTGLLVVLGTSVVLSSDLHSAEPFDYASHGLGRCDQTLLVIHIAICTALWMNLRKEPEDGFRMRSQMMYSLPAMAVQWLFTRLWANIAGVTNQPPPVDAYLSVFLYGVVWYATARWAIIASYNDHAATSGGGSFVIPLRFVTGLADLLDPHIGTLGLDSFLAFLATEFIPQDLIFWREVQDLRALHQQRIKVAAVEGRSATARKIRDRSFEIFSRFVKRGALNLVVLPPAVVDAIAMRLGITTSASSSAFNMSTVESAAIDEDSRTGQAQRLAQMVSAYDEAQSIVYERLQNNHFQRYLRSTHFTSIKPQLDACFDRPSVGSQQKPRRWKYARASGRTLPNAGNSNAAAAANPASLLAPAPGQPPIDSSGRSWPSPLGPTPMAAFASASAPVPAPPHIALSIAQAGTGTGGGGGLVPGLPLPLPLPGSAGPGTDGVSPTVNDMPVTPQHQQHQHEQLQLHRQGSAEEERTRTGPVDPQPEPPPSLLPPPPRALAPSPPTLAPAAPAAGLATSPSPVYAGILTAPTTTTAAAAAVAPLLPPGSGAGAEVARDGVAAAAAAALTRRASDANAEGGSGSRRSRLPKGRSLQDVMADVRAASGGAARRKHSRSRAESLGGAAVAAAAAGDTSGRERAKGRESRRAAPVLASGPDPAPAPAPAPALAPASVSGSRPRVPSYGRPSRDARLSASERQREAMLMSVSGLSADPDGEDEDEAIPERASVRADRATRAQLYQAQYGPLPQQVVAYHHTQPHQPLPTASMHQPQHQPQHESPPDG